MNRINLQSTLYALEEFLRKHEVPYEEVVRRLRQRLEASTGTEVSSETLNEVRELFGGMGSLNDVYISKANGHVVDDETTVNKELQVLTQELWELVSEDKGPG